MRSYFSLVKFSHTIFAMPFAILGFFLAVVLGKVSIEGWLLVKVVLCMVFARNAAMGFNRWVDRDIDAQNPRTAVREIPAGIISADRAIWFVVWNALFFVITCYFINTLCFFLSPVALVVILGYSLTKRFTYLCHMVLGLGLALAPIGAFLAVNPVFEWSPVLIGVGVLFWVSGFDIVYALQDDSFDRENHLFSIPSFFGRERALWLSRGLHLMSALIMLAALILVEQRVSFVGPLSWLAWIFFVGFLVYQHFLVKPTDLSKVNLAFFTMNGLASLIYCLLIILDLIVL